MFGTTASAPGRASVGGEGLRRVRRRLRRHRRLTAAILLGLAVLVTVSALRPPDPVTVPVVVAARDLPAGAPLAAADVRVRQVPTDYAPPGAFEAADQVADRVLVGPLRAGEPVTPTRVVGGGLPATAEETAAGTGTGDPGRPSVRPAEGPGLVAAPVRIADPGAVALLAPGDVVDVIAARGGGMESASAQVVARAVRVLTVPRKRTGDGGLLSGGGTDLSAGADGALVVLAVLPTTAVDLARAAASGRLAVVLHGA